MSGSFWLFVVSLLLNLFLLVYIYTPYVDHKESLSREILHVSSIESWCATEGAEDEYRFWQSIEQQLVDRRMSIHE